MQAYKREYLTGAQSELLTARKKQKPLDKAHPEKSQCRNKEYEGTLTVREWRSEVAFENSTGFLAISEEGTC